MGAKVMFLFGAGAERVRELPTGREYTKKTMLQKNKNLYAALNEFYSDTAKNGVSYEKRYLFYSGSHTFFEIVVRALEQYTEKNKAAPNSKHKKMNSLLRAFEEYKKSPGEKNRKKKLKAEVNAVYKYFIDSGKIGAGKNSDTDPYDEIIKCFTYYGTVEKDFASIIDPCAAGKRVFWRLINYFWTAFFAIYGPLTTGKEFKDVKEYREVLGNLSKVAEAWKSDEVKDLCKDKYYGHFRENYPNSVAATTNYTPFVEQYWGENSIYLAGKLIQMEDPYNLELLDLRENQDFQDRLVFPFMMTQAPVKPIVFPEQIREYSRFASALDESDILVILGYSLNESDNHINVYLRDYLKRDNKKIIYCAHYEEGKKVKNEEWVLKQLRIAEADPIGERMEVIPFSDEKALYAELEHRISELQEETRK